MVTRKTRLLFAKSIVEMTSTWALSQFVVRRRRKKIAVDPGAAATSG